MSSKKLNETEKALLSCVEFMSRMGPAGSNPPSEWDRANKLAAASRVLLGVQPSLKKDPYYGPILTGARGVTHL